MSYSVYILISEKDKGLYVGCTSNLEKRLKRHNDGKVKSTKGRRPFNCLYQEIYEDKGEAYNRERFLKSLWSSRFKANLKKKYLQSRT